VTFAYCAWPVLCLLCFACCALPAVLCLCFALLCFVLLCFACSLPLFSAIVKPKSKPAGV